MDYGIKVSGEGNDITKAQAKDLLMSSQYPFAKLDSTNKASFQNIDLVFATDPPEPSGVDDSYTTVYSFNHNYLYWPSVWFLFQVLSPPAGTNFYQEYFQDLGVIAAQTAADQTTIRAKVDDTKVRIIVHKFRVSGLGSANNLIGTHIRLRPYVFVENIWQ